MAVLQREALLFNWSGGKDSSLTLYHTLRLSQYEVKYLLTSINEKFNRVSMHGVRVSLVEKQAQSIGIPLRLLSVPGTVSMETYDNLMRQSLEQFKNEGIKTTVFGDIFLEDLRKYREDQLAKIGMKGIFPIWKKSTTALVQEFMDLGFKSVVVCVNEKFLDKSFVGRTIDESFINDLPEGVDPCGENGEFHSFVYDGPIFKQPIAFKRGEIVYREYKKDESTEDDEHTYDCSQNYDTGFWYCDLEPGRDE